MTKERDPTKTKTQRVSFRAEFDRRVSIFLGHLRQTIIDQDMLGLARMDIHPMFQTMGEPPDLETKLVVLTNYINQLGYMVIVQEATWMRPRMERAFDSGVRVGRAWSKREIDDTMMSIYFQFAKNELEGIVDATVQRAARVAHLGIIKHDRPPQLYQRIAIVTREVTLPRAYMLANQLVVHQHNLGRIAQIKAAGFSRLGIVPEHLPAGLARKRRHRDETIKDEELVNILTAGDDLVCEDCEAYAEDGPYDVDEVEIPLHPNCRCAVVPFDDRRFSTNVENLEEFLSRGEEFLELEE
jgi:hypothetical protein